MGDRITGVELQQNPPSAFTEEYFRNVFQYHEQEKPPTWTILRNKFKCSKNFIVDLLPVIQWLPRYDYRNNIFSDILVAAIMTPMLVQIELAYVHIAKLPLVVGLYASVFPPIIYFLMGTSRHIAIGLNGVISMMVANTISKHVNNDYPSGQEYPSLQIAVALAFLTGLWLLIFAAFRLGWLCVFLSNSFSSGYYIGGSIQVIFHQLDTLFGIEYPDPPNIFRMFYVCYELFKNISKINLVAFGLSILTILSLLMFNLYVKPVIRKRYPKSGVHIIFEIVIVIFATTLSYFLDFENNYKVKIIGYIPPGLPSIIIPPFEVFPKLILDSFILALVVIPIFLPLTKIIANKHGYRINNNQELLAYGVSSIVCSFFSCPLAGNSVGRTFIQDAIGGGSQFTNLFTVLFVIFILLFAGPIMTFIPVCVLSSMIIVHLMKQVIPIKNFVKIYRTSKIDFAVELVTLISLLILDMDYGIIIGMIASILSTLIPSQKSRLMVLGPVPGTEIFLDKNHYKAAVAMEGTLILKIIGNIHFANSENVQDKILDQIQNHQTSRIRCIILNLACVGYIDPSGVKSLLTVLDHFKKIKNPPILLLTDCLPNVYEKFSVCEFFNVFPKNHVFPSVKDAIEFFNLDQVTPDFYVTEL